MVLAYVGIWGTKSKKEASRVLMPKLSFVRFLTASGKVFSRGECASKLRSLG